jgi:hypothetical protein
MLTTGPVNQQDYLALLLVNIGYDLFYQNAYDPLLQSHIRCWRIPNRRKILCQTQQELFIWNSQCG